jgi:serine/threonine protein kinase
LEYLHSNGVIHGNLKQVSRPLQVLSLCEVLTRMMLKENILVNSAGHACLSDIRFSRLASAGETGFDWVRVGTDGCRWAAPEVFQKGGFTRESDVFAYGFLAAEVCFRPRLPISTTDHAKICAGGIFWGEIGTKDMKSKLDRDERPGLPTSDKEHASVITELWRVFSRCWVKDPKGRISILDALNPLQYLWVLVSPSQVISTNSL